ncbi:MAG: response regulator [Pontixanthobacter sp.]
MPQVLIVDDEFMTAMAFAEFLSDKGYTIIGPYAHADDALEALETAEPDAAFLDINLGGGETSEKIASHLKARSTPFAFLTGYSECPPVMADFEDARYLAKPLPQAEALAELKKMIEPKKLKPSLSERHGQVSMESITSPISCEASIA